MNSILSYSGRLLKAIILSGIIGMVSSFICNGVGGVIYVIGPRLLSKSLWISTADVAHNVYMDSLIPGFGQLSSIVNNPSFSERTILLITCLCALLLIVTLVWLTSLLIKIQQKQRVIIIISTIALLFGFVVSFIYSTYGLYQSDLQNDKSAWFYIMAVIIVLANCLAAFIISSFCWGKLKKAK